MNQTGRILLFGGILLVVVLGLYVFLFSSPQYNWDEDYRFNSDQPYGSAVLFELLGDYFPEGRPTLLDEATSGLNLPLAPNGKVYLFIGSQHYGNADEVQHILRFASAGNTVMVIASVLPSSFFRPLSLPDSVNTEDLLEFHSDSVRAPLLEGPSYSGKAVRSTVFYRVRAHREAYAYGTFRDSMLQQCSEVDILGRLDGKPNFIRYGLGEGQVLIHTTPLAFSNLHAGRREHRKYLESVLRFAAGDKVYWDAYHAYPHNENEPQDLSAPDSPFVFLFRNTALRWAFYLLLAVTLVYVLFSTRRIQRAIPIIEPPQNHSLNFIRSMGLLYFRERQHQTMVRHQMRYLMGWLREKYRLRIDDLDEHTALQIHLRTGAPREVVDALVHQYQRVKVYAVLEDADALEFYHHLQKFYNSCKS